MKNILFLAHRIPFPPNKGDKIRSYHFLSYLTTIYNVYLGAFIDDPNDWQYTEKLDVICIETFYLKLNTFKAKLKSLKGFLTGEALSLPYYRSETMQHWVDSTITKNSISKVFIFSSVMAQFIKKTHDVEMFVDFVDVDSDKWRQYATSKSGLSALIYQRESNYLSSYEKKIAEQAKVSFFVSEQEANLFKLLVPANLRKKITSISNGVDTNFFSSEQLFISPYAINEDVIVFTGAMDYWANVDAVKWFSDEILPIILLNFPLVKFYIVGSKPTKTVKALANKSVVVTGTVEDIRPYITHARLAIAPLRIARGIQNKVLEAMAMGKYVVTTSAAMEGISYDKSLDVFIGDNIDEVAKLLNKLLQKKSAEMISNVNRKFVIDNYSWNKNANKLIELLEE
ncbi:MAG: TIGR03087 family PEP-CTERM/XrtA system glycosyltransferase [Methylococcales bacterium]|nr:TIGR03087 family PEP-CTERM/XrtA system glycosyltransferase [Methylococcales bacterium]